MMILKCIRELPSNAICTHFVLGNMGSDSLVMLLVCSLSHVRCFLGCSSSYGGIGIGSEGLRDLHGQWNKVIPKQNHTISEGYSQSGVKCLK